MIKFNYISAFLAIQPSVSDINTAAVNLEAQAERYDAMSAECNPLFARGFQIVARDYRETALALYDMAYEAASFVVVPELEAA